MRRWLQSFGTRATMAAAVLLLAAGVGVAFYNEDVYRSQKIREVRVEADILASSVTAALAFGDRKTAQEYVDALRVNPEVRAVAVYDSEGAPFASFVRGDKIVLPNAVTIGEQYFSGGYLVVTRPVRQSGELLGAAYLQTIEEPWGQRFARYAAIGLLAVMAALIVTALGAAQVALSRANRELAARAEDLARTNAELRAQSAEREKAEEALRQAQKMETIGQLTGGVAHDFNNLLTIVIGNLERVRRRTRDGAAAAAVEAAAEAAMQGAVRAATLTRSLLAFSRRQPLDPKPTDLNRLVSTMSDLLRRTLGEQIAIETVVAGGLWRTLADPNQLENALLNLAVNARDAMPGGGKLTIETANTFLDERYAAAEQDVLPGQYVVLSVTDSGSGMSREVMDKVFEPFFTTKDVGHGTGLGLSQVYGFVKQSGGHIKIYSELGQGTTVKIYLPRLTAEEGSDAAAAEPAAAPHGSAETVLVVEDDPGVRAHSVEILVELGYRVLAASQGREALDLLDRRPEIALLFTDVGLPEGMNGRVLADEARRRRPKLPVLFTTGYARNAIVHDGRLDPGVRLVTKPFTYAELGAAVRAALDGGDAERPGRAARGAPPPPAASAAHAPAPAATPALSPSPPTAATPLGPSGAGGRVLLVEDEALIRLSAAEALKEFGLEVDEAGTAAAALDRMREGAGAVTAAIVDLGLPDRRGDALVDDLLALAPDLAVIIATGLADDAVQARFADDPRVRFLQKPYDDRKLRAALEAAGVLDPVV